MIVIKKVKLDPSKSRKVYMEYESVRQGTGNDEHTVSSCDEPHPDFVKAFLDLRLCLLNEAEIGRSFTEDDVKVTGVSISHSEIQGLGAVISGNITLAESNSPLCINTPFKPSLAENAPNLSEDTLDCILNVISEAEAFIIDGKRSQGELFADSNEPKLLTGGQMVLSDGAAA